MHVSHVVLNFQGKKMYFLQVLKSFRGLRGTHCRKKVFLDLCEIKDIKRPVPPYFLLVLKSLLKIGPLLVLHEVKAVGQMKQNTQKAKGKRRGKRKDG